MRTRNFLIILALVAVSLFATSSFFDTDAGGGQPGWVGTSGSPDVFLIEVVKGNVPGHTVRHRFGKGIVGTTMVPIASSLKYPTPIAATTLEVVSDDADDTVAGAGARTVTVMGLDSNWEEITQTVNMAGLTPVPLPIDMIRVYDWWVETSGVYATSGTGSHQGVITIQTSPGAVLWFNGVVTPYPKGQSEISGFTVPVGFRAYVFIHGIVADSTKSVDVMFIKRIDAGDVTTPFSPMRAVKDFTGVSDHSVGFDSGAPVNAFSAKTDLIFMGVVSSGTASISVDYEILLIADGY
jgi:hypothetical protein